MAAYTGMWPLAGVPPEPPKDSSRLGIGYLMIGPRASNALKKHGIVDVEQLVSVGRKRIAMVPNIGKKSADEIIEAVELLYLFLGTMQHRDLEQMAKTLPGVGTKPNWAD